MTPNLVDRLYEASVLPELWPGLLHDLARLATDGHGIIFSGYGNDVRFVASSPEYQSVAQEFFRRYPNNERTKRLLAKRRAGFLTDSEEFAPGERERLPIFRDYFFPRGYGEGAATVIDMPTGNTVVVHFEGNYARGAISPAKVEWLNLLRPHLARSTLISSHLAFERARTAVETLAGLGLSACAVRESGSVLVTNAEFEKDRLVWTTRGGDRVGLLDSRANRQLQEALERIRDREIVRSIALSGEGDRPPAVLHVVPVRRTALDLFASASAILVLTKPMAQASHSTPLLQALFDLTATEAELAARIAEGETAQEIAKGDAKSVHTVRNQLKSLLHKTGCQRQVDLTRLLTQLLLP